MYGRMHRELNIYNYLNNLCSYLYFQETQSMGEGGNGKIFQSTQGLRHGNRPKKYCEAFDWLNLNVTDLCHSDS